MQQNAANKQKNESYQSNIIFKILKRIRFYTCCLFFVAIFWYIASRKYFLHPPFGVICKL